MSGPRRMTPYGLTTYWAHRTHKSTLMKIGIINENFQLGIPMILTTTTHHQEGDHQVEDHLAVDLMEIKTHGFHECLEALMVHQVEVTQEDLWVADHH